MVLLLLLAATLASSPAEAFDELDPPDQSRLAKKQRNPNEEPEGTEASADESSGAVDSASSEDSSPEAKIEEELPLEWKFYWHEGLHFWLQQKAIISPEKHALDLFRPKPRLEGKIGSMLQVDAAAFASDDEFEGFSDGVQLRRFRLYTKGNFFFWVPVYFSFQFGITEDAFYLNDGYLQFRNIPWIQTFTVGFLKAPFSLERLASGRDTTFMERASPVDAFSPGFKAGLKASGNEFGDRMSWALGWFADGQEADIGDVTDSNFRIVGRVMGLPFYTKGLYNNRLMHLGLSYSYVNAQGNSVQYRSRPECHNAPLVVDTGEIPANNANLLGAELAFVMNSLSAQVEYIRSFVNAEEGENLQFDGYYAFVSFFATGETRLYDTIQGVFTRVRPRENFSLRNHTYGGIEIEARYSHLDLNDGDIAGGRMNIVTAGVTWHLFPIFKLKFNYGNADIDNWVADDRVHIFQTRFEVDL
jgi:phosphate-selective porin OprO/OprP